MIVLHSNAATNANKLARRSNILPLHESRMLRAHVKPVVRERRNSAAFGV
jgi:hypothetical protein